MRCLNERLDRGPLDHESKRIRTAHRPGNIGDIVGVSEHRGQGDSKRGLEETLVKGFRMARSKRSSELRATLLGSMGTTGYEMSKREREKRNRPRHEVNIRHLHNGVGVAGVLGIVSIFAYMAVAYLALGPDSPGAPSAVTSGVTTPLTSTSGSALSPGVSGALPPILAPSTVFTSSSSSVGSPSSLTHTNNRVASTAPGPKSTTINPVATDTSAPPGATTQPQVATTSGATTLAPPFRSTSTTTSSTTSTTSTTAPATTAPARTVEGTEVTLGAGEFTGGTDVAPGLYDVTTSPGQSGGFVVSGTDSYNEVLDSSGNRGVPEIRAQISKGDQIQISGLSQVFFTPVSTPFVTTQSVATLYPGTWTVGQDLGPGEYVATPGAGQSGTFIITSENVNERLGGDPGSGAVSSVTFNVQIGDVIEISGLKQVTLTPS